MKKLFTLMTLALLSIGSAWGETAVISPANMTSQGSGTLGSTTAGNVWYGNGTTLESGFIIQITGNPGKAFSKQSTVKVGNTSYDSFKNSNGAQNTITLPTGYTAKSVTFYVTANDAENDAKLSEINGESCNDAVTSHKDGENPTVITKTLNSNSFTFTFSNKQVFFVAVVTYQLPLPDITTQPVSATYQKDDAATALTVVATASAGELSYQWYSCDDANKTNATAIVGETSASYTPSTSAIGTFYYFCRVTDTNGNTDSNVATITVADASAPTISAEATASTVYVGNDVILTATVDGVPAPTIQWYSCDDAAKTNAAAIDGATNTTYAPSTATAGTYYYYAIATNSEGSATSDVITLTVNPLYTVTYSIGDATGVEGTVPASVDVESAVTIPTNQTLFKEGYTLTGWNDGTITYAAGASATITANTTMTAVFTENTGELGLCPASVTWQFQTGQGAPTWAHEGDAAFKYVAQMALGSETIDMPLTMDASSGKIANANWGDWCQMNGGTKLTAPAIKGAVLKLYVYGEGSTAVTFNGTVGTYSSNIYSYTATAADETTGSVEVVIGDQSYIKYLTVTYPLNGVKVYDFATEVGTGISGDENNVSKVTDQTINGVKPNAIRLASSLNSGNPGRYWKITPSAGKFKKGDRIIWTGCYNNNETKTTTIWIFDNKSAISSTTPIVTGESFANVNGGTAASPKPLTTGFFTLTADADTLYIGRTGGTATYLTELTVVREMESGEITATGYNTFSSCCPLDLSTISGGTAYVASSVTNGKVVLTKSEAIVPAGTGLFIAGTAEEEFSIETTDAEPSFTDINLLVGAPNGIEVPVAEEGYNYVFGWQEVTNPGFYKVVSDLPTIGAGKAYLHTTDELTVPSASRLAIAFEEDITGISTVEAVESADNAVYNLRGQRVTKPTKGLFIVNGKKVIMN